MFADAAPIVLIVEDEPLIRMTAADIVADIGVETLEAADAHEALDLLSEYPGIHLIVTDINMPGGMDGVALARRAHELRPDVPVIVTSGRQHLSEDQLPEKSAFLPKPYGSQQLVRIVEKVLRACGWRRRAT